MNKLWCWQTGCGFKSPPTQSPKPLTVTMTNITIDISAKPLKDFLDGVDIVLNSNTFLLTFDIKNGSVTKSLEAFIKSNDFITQIIRQDSERDWYNMQYFDNLDSTFIQRPGNLISKTIELKIDTPQVDKREYLIAMLTGDTSIGRFFSFYSYQKERNEAETIVDNFISYLSTNADWTLSVVKPDFLKDNVQENAKKGELKYFNGDYGNDTATLIECRNKGFLLLTNGTD